MTYFQNLNRLILRELELRADQFVDLYDPGRRSVILIPGGMGSRLLQCQHPFREENFPQNPAFGEVWLNWPAVLFGKIGELGLDADGWDHADKPVIASGEMNSIVKSYDGTEAYFIDQGFNYTEFGYDWRRELRSAAAYLKTFLQMIKTKAMQKVGGGHNPLTRLTLFAHSMGGMVGKLLIDALLDDGQDPKQWFSRFVSVATPFYGTETHIYRLYQGQRLINLLLGSTEKVAFMVASLPGPYGLLPAPRDVLEPLLDDLQLTRYPVRDRSGARGPVDPFGDDGLERFPDYTDRSYFARARAMFARIGKKLPQGLNDRIFHVRNNIRSGAQPLEWDWRAIDGLSYDHVRDELPIAANGGASDGAVPFWSARLAGTPDDQVFSLALDTDHGALAEDERVLEMVKEVANEAAVAPEALVPAAGEGPIGPLSSGIYDADLKALIDDITRGRSDENSINNVPASIRRALMGALSVC